MKAWQTDPMCCPDCETPLEPEDVDLQLSVNAFFDGLCQVCFRELDIPAPTGMEALIR